MEPIAKPRFYHSGYHPVLFGTYRVVRQLAKYTLYGSILYFAYEGFMAWP